MMDYIPDFLIGVNWWYVIFDLAAVVYICIYLYMVYIYSLCLIHNKKSYFNLLNIPLMIIPLLGMVIFCESFDTGTRRLNIKDYWSVVVYPSGWYRNVWTSCIYFIPVLGLGLLWLM